MVTNRETFASSFAFHVLVIIRISRCFQCRMDMRLMFFCFKRFALLSLKIQYFLFNFLTYILNLSVSVTKTSGPSFCIFWIKTNIWTNERNYCSTNFYVRQVYFTKSCPQIWVRANQPFILYIHHIWGERVLWGAVFIIQTSDNWQSVSQFFKTNCIHSIFRTIEARVGF